MKRNMKKYVISGLLLLALLASGCGAANKSEAAYTEEATAAAAYDTGDIYTYDGSAEISNEEAADTTANKKVDSSEVQSTNRKLIKTVDMEVETESFDELMNNLEKKTEAFGGYIESSDLYNGSNYYGSPQRNSSMTIRIPAASLKEFLFCVGEDSNIINQRENVDDVTLSYVDMDSHKKALQAEQTSLLDLLEKAETIEDIIALESRLSDVRYQIESMESQLRSIDNQVSFSTVHLQVSEVVQYTPPKDRSRVEKIADGFVNSLKNIWNGILDFFVWFIIAIPYLVLCTVIVLIIIGIVKLISKHNSKKQLKQQQKEDTMQQKKVNSGSNEESKGNEN